jgi:hypothetical protein
VEIGVGSRGGHNLGPRYLTCKALFGGALGFGRFPSFGISPQVLELVEDARLWVEDVHHEVDVVEQNPPPAGEPLDVSRGHVLGVEPLRDAVGDGLHVRVGRAAHHDEPVRGGRDPSQIQHDHVLRLAIERELDRAADVLRQMRAERDRCLGGRFLPGAQLSARSTRISTSTLTSACR